MKPVSKKSGFTLLEVILYIALFSILMSGAVVSAYQLMGGGAHTEHAVLVQEEGTFLIRKINWALTGASAAVSAGNTLTVTRPDLGAQSPVVITASGADVVLTRGGGTQVPLNTAALPVSNLNFTVTPAAFGRPTEVDVSFQVDTRPFVFKTYLRQ